LLDKDGSFAHAQGRPSRTVGPTLRPENIQETFMENTETLHCAFKPALE
jgi:hypothetical protein